jgi:hypothetical protein
VLLVLQLLRRNPVQAEAAGFFNVSQATVSRRRDLLRPVIAEVLADLVPAPRAMIRAGTALLDGAVAPTRDRRHRDELYSVKAGHAGMNVQIACSMDGIRQLAEPGYVGVEGVDPAPYMRLPGRDLLEKITSRTTPRSPAYARQRNAPWPTRSPGTSRARKTDATTHRRASPRSPRPSRHHRTHQPTKVRESSLRIEPRLHRADSSPEPVSAATSRRKVGVALGPEQSAVAGSVSQRTWIARPRCAIGLCTRRAELLCIDL